MGNSYEASAKQSMSSGREKGGNGLQNLVMHYQDLFETDENLNHYSPADYQDAKRKFVKYCLKSRTM